MPTPLLPTFYDVGLISLENGETTFTITGGSVEVPWGSDLLFVPSQPLVPTQRIASFEAGVGELAFPWPGSTETDVAYEVRYVGMIERSTAQSRRLLEQLGVVEANGRGLFYRFSDVVIDADPSSGYMRLNNATIGSATAAYIDNLDANGATVSAEIDTWDDSSSITKGKLWLRSIADPSAFHAFRVTGSVVDGTGYRKLTLEYVGGSSSFAADDELMAFFAPKGDQGDSFAYDVSVADIAARAAYDAEAEGFVILVLDDGAGRSAFYTMGDGGSGDWEITGYLTGPRGTEWQGAWLTVTAYAVNDLVATAGATYICIEAHTSGTFATDLAADKWELFAAKGDKGAQWEGVWVTATAYAVDDIVRFDGSSYICLIAHTSGTFSTDLAALNWELVVEKGGTGATGAPGGGLKGIACRVAATANVAIATALEAGDAIDGVTLSSGDLVLLTAQTAPEENGVYIASVSGAAARHTDFDVWTDFPGSYFPVNEGTSNADTLWRCTSNPGGTLGTTALVFGQFQTSAGTVTPQCRITLTSGAPVMETDVSAATTVYVTNFGGNLIPLYNGAGFAATEFAETSQATTDATKSPAACAADSNYDIFAWDDAGTKRTTRGPAWTTSRGTGAGTSELVWIDGIPLNANSITNGPAAERGTYLGTIRTNASSTVDWIFAGAATGGKAGKFGIWNAWNRTPIVSQVLLAEGSWTYATATWRPANGSSTVDVSFVRGLSVEDVKAKVSNVCAVASGGQGLVGIGVNSTTAPSGLGSISTQTTFNQLISEYAGKPAIGWNTITYLENGNPGGTTTFYGSSLYSGMTVELWA